MKCVDRFLNYVNIDTTSDPKSHRHPSTEKQKTLARLLVDEMKAIGVSDVYMDEMAYVYGTIPANCDKSVKTIGFIAHLDTSCDMPGGNIKPRIIENYNGEDIVLNNKEKITMQVRQFPFLKDLKGRSLIVTDGTTLLGADNKAGIAEIMTMAETLLTHPEIKHGTIKIGFTPDEEIGEGADGFDIKRFGCDFAYTCDGSKEGYINYENFNAASADLTFRGVNIHPGTAKERMVNSIHLAYEFHNMLPTFQNPAYTENYEGFNHLNEIQGTVEKTATHYIIRNHDMKKFKQQKEAFTKIAAFLNDKYGENTCEVVLKDTYYNMYEYLKDHMEIIDIAKTSITKAGVTPVIEPIRGGTDGARLTYEGLMCPNLGTGGFNFHGRYECITIEGMEKSVQILLNIVNEVYQK